MSMPSTFPPMRITGKVRHLVIVLGDQLDHDSVAFDGSTTNATLRS